MAPGCRCSRIRGHGQNERKPIAICYVLPVLWITSRFPITGAMEACRYRCSDAAAASDVGPCCLVSILAFPIDETRADAKTRRVHRAKGSGGGVCDIPLYCFDRCRWLVNGCRTYLTYISSHRKISTSIARSCSGRRRSVLYSNSRRRSVARFLQLKDSQNSSTNSSLL